MGLEGTQVMGSIIYTLVSKTSGSVLHGLVYTHECALLVNFCIHDAKKNPGGRTGYPKNYWNHVFVSPKCGKRLGYARY
jgi:hypothetical protein